MSAGAAERFLLDTNTVSQIIRGVPPRVSERLAATPIEQLFLSAITEGELMFGLARRPEAVRLAEAVAAFLRRVEVLPWDSAAAARYGPLRADLEAAGRPRGNLDTLIAAHALAAGATLVSSDLAFARVPDLATVDWAGG